MAVVEMKCPNCGGKMGLINNQFMCPNCRTMILNIMDAKIDADVTVMSPDEFAKKIEESKRQFVVNINDNIQVFDVQTKIINKKIADATALLESGDFDKVESALSDVPDTVLSAERLRFLSQYKARNEYELSYYDGYIDVENRRYGGTCPNTHYQNILKLADEQTRATYIKIAAYCREQFDTKKKIEEEIKEVEGLLAVKLYTDAVAYAKEMCRKYPQTVLSWAYLCTVKYTISNNYNCDAEYTMMQKCVDYTEEKIPSFLKDKIAQAQKKVDQHYAGKKTFAWCFFGVGALTTIVAGLFYFQQITSSTGNGGLILIGILSYLLQLGCGLGVLGCLFSSLGYLGCFISNSDAEKAVQLLPLEVKKKMLNRTSPSYLKILVLVAPFLIALGVYLIVNFFTKFI